MKTWEVRGSEVTISEAGLANSPVRLIPANAVLVVVRSGVLKHTVPIALNRVPVTINQDMKAIVCDESLHADYLARFLKQRSPQILQWVRATTADNFPVDRLKDLEIPLPPLPEQRRIAEILDKSDALRAKRRAALAQLDTLTQSIFLDMFGDPATNPRGFRMSTIGEMADKVTDGEHITPKREQAGIPLLSAKNIRDGYIDFSAVDYVSVQEHQRIRKRCDPSPGDVLISCSGTIGRVATVETSEQFSLVRSVAMVRPRSSQVRSKFIEHYLRTPALKHRMLRRANASSQANLFQNQIRSLPVMLPAIDLQDTFAARVRCVDALRTRQRGSLATIESLVASLHRCLFSS
jgi:type I restriction enzyme, S subunit